MADVEHTISRHKRRLRPERIAAIYVCMSCGTEFHPKRTDRTKYCSRVCAYSDQKQWQAKVEVKEKPDPFSRIWPVACAICQTTFIAKHPKHKYCGPTCVRVAYPIKNVQPRAFTCIDCGTPSVAMRATRCKRCQIKATRAASRLKHGKVKKHRHRAKRYGVPYEPINPVVVFERDGWCCQLCGIPTPKALKGINHSAAPTLDHIVPMSMGGSHEFINVQCACRGCNTRKGTLPNGLMKRERPTGGTKIL